MNIQLVSCNSARPDRRAITKMFEEIAFMDNSLAREETDNLLSGSPVEIEVSDKTTSSAFRAIRKLDIDYEIIED